MCGSVWESVYVLLYLASWAIPLSQETQQLLFPTYWHNPVFLFTKIGNYLLRFWWRWNWSTVWFSHSVNLSLSVPLSLLLAGMISIQLSTKSNNNKEVLICSPPSHTFFIKSKKDCKYLSQLIDIVPFAQEKARQKEQKQTILHIVVPQLLAYM